MSTLALNGKVALVTGSTSGIGLGVARALAAAGAEIVLNGFGRPEDIGAAQAQIEQEFRVRTLYLGADMSKPGENSPPRPRSHSSLKAKVSASAAPH